MKSLNQLTTILFSALFSLATLLSAQAHAEADLYFIHSDHLGTPQAMTDSAQNVVWKTQQTPFGETVEESGSVVQPLRFPGQYADQESGLSYNYFRDYDPSLGRYVQSDPIGLVGGLNTFVYVTNSPFNLIDPRGLKGSVVVIVPSSPIRLPNAPLVPGGNLLGSASEFYPSIGPEVKPDSNVIPFPAPKRPENYCPGADEDGDGDDKDPCEEWLEDLLEMTIAYKLGIVNMDDLTKRALNNSIKAFKRSCPHLASQISEI